MTTESDARILLDMSSGKQLIVSRVMLFPEADFHEVVSLKAKAQEEMGGFSTGVGFWGSPSWALGGAAALGIVESLISGSKMKKGLELLKQAADKYERLKTKGMFHAVSLIDRIDRPSPAYWRAFHTGEFQLDLQSLGWSERERVIQQYKISKAQIDRGIATVTAPRAFIHNEDEFVWVEVDSQPIAVRWNFVECYECKGLPVTADKPEHDPGDKIEAYKPPRGLD